MEEGFKAVWKVELTTISTIPPNAQALGLDSGEKKCNGFAKSGGIDVGCSVLVANSSVREIEPLPWDIAVCVGGIVRSKPVGGETKKKTKRCQQEAPLKKRTIVEVERQSSQYAPSLDKNLFRPVRCAGCSSGPNVRGQFFQSMVRRRSHAHPSRTSGSGTRQASKSPRDVHSLLGEVLMLVWVVG